MAKNTKQPVHKLTLDEYDELTLSNQILGASTERGNIMIELNRRIAELMELSDLLCLPNFTEEAKEAARGLSAAMEVIANLPTYEDNVGCRECGVI